MDIFDLVSDMQQEAIKEEKLVKEKRRQLKGQKGVKEMQKRKEWENEVDREKEKDDKEVLCRRGLNYSESHKHHFVNWVLTLTRTLFPDLKFRLNTEVYTQICKFEQTFNVVTE